MSFGGKFLAAGKKWIAVATDFWRTKGPGEISLPCPTSFVLSEGTRNMVCSLTVQSHAFRMPGWRLASLGIVLGSLAIAMPGIAPAQGPKPATNKQRPPAIRLAQNPKVAEPNAEDVAAAQRKRAASDRQIINTVFTLMKQDHLTKHPLDDEISQRALTLFLKSLDPLKMYFYQSDIDEFERSRNQLDDMVGTKKDSSFGYQVFARWIERVQERVVMINQILKEDLDFSTHETLVTDGEKLRYPTTPEEAMARWRKRVKYDLLLLTSDKTEKMTPEAARQRVARRYNALLRNASQTEADEQLETFVTSITSSFDPHTNYMSPSSLDDFEMQMRLSLDGIGAALQSIDGYTEVSKIVPGGAADKQGELKEKDRIVSVGQGTEGEMVDVNEMKLKKIVDQIRGKAGTIVRLGVIPAGTNETKTIQITRAKIELKDSEARGEIIESGENPSGGPYKFGFIDLPSFYLDMDAARKNVPDYKSTTKDCEKILRDFKAKGVDCVVLDLRKNGGGSLQEAISLTGLFIHTGPVVQVKDSAGEIHAYNDDKDEMLWSGPLVVLTSKFSASASEIFAGAIQDYQRGLVVGDTTTHGKGTVQSLVELGNALFAGGRKPPNLGALKITMQQFYRPSGDSTQKRGVQSDVVLPSITDKMDVAESDLDYALEFDKVEEQPHARFNQMSKALTRDLQARSQARVAESADFQKLAKNITRFVEQKTKKEVQLNITDFQAQREEIDSEREQEKIAEEHEKSRDKVVLKNFYTDEVLHIAVDYLNLLGQNKVAKAK
jgi:carboxyl-terminal processing protease